MQDLISQPREVRLLQRSTHHLARLERAAWSFTTRRVSRRVVSRILDEQVEPAPGDLVLARIDDLGHHQALQLPSGRKQKLFPGDEIVVVYGNRYAPNQFEAIVPKTMGPCQLVAGGGVASKALSWHRQISRGPTQITPIGLLGYETGKRANLADFALDSSDRLLLAPPPTIVVVGTAMDSGKTQTAAYLTKGLTRAGVRVGFAKVTGTGAGGDTWLLRDAGADPVIDFTDAGLASTYLVSAPVMENVFVTLTAHLTKCGVEAIVMEIADGLLQPETSALLTSSTFKNVAGAIIFAARDSMGAVAGVDWLRRAGLPAVGLSGVLTAACLQSREATLATGLPTLSREALGKPKTALQLLAAAKNRSALRGDIS